MEILFLQSTARSSGPRAKRIARSGWLPTVASQARRQAKSLGAEITRTILRRRRVCLHTGARLLALTIQLPLGVRAADGARSHERLGRIVDSDGRSIRQPQ